MDGTYGAKRTLLILMTGSSDPDRSRGLERVFYYKNYPAMPGRGIGGGERRGGRLRETPSFARYRSVFSAARGKKAERMGARKRAVRPPENPLL